MVESSHSLSAWEADRHKRFAAGRSAHPDLEVRLKDLKDRTARLASERREEQRTRWARTCDALAEQSGKLGEAQRVRIPALQREAETLAAAGDREGSISLYAQILEVDPANVEANYGLGEGLRQGGDLAGAARCFALAAAFPKAGSNNGYFKTMFALQGMPPPPDPRLGEPSVIFRVEGAPTELWDAPWAPVMTVIPGGEFTMGSLETEANRGPAETPHRVSIGYPLAVSRYDVTRGEFAAFVAETGYDAERGGDCQVFRNGTFVVDPEASWRRPGFEQTDDEPVVCVSYFDGVAYADWLTRTTGHNYRLPSEAEWEHAVRGGTASGYYWGEEIGVGHAHCDGCNPGPALLQPTPGGTFPPNAFGLHDVVGNVWKWLADCWNPSYVGAPDDGSDWTEGVTALRGRRGGSWFNISEARAGDFRAPHRLRSAARFGSLPHLRFSSFGLRVVRDL
jgi:formylglycine-generating enzyme required for sulfatase activity